jgi:hypothetical protein
LQIKSGLRAILELVTRGHSPLQVGDIAVSDDGQICLRSGDQPLLFAFAYRGVDFEARMETAPTARIALSAELGKLPYSMETQRGRRLTRRIVAATTDLPGGKIVVSDDQDMSLVASAQPPLPLTPASVMATITSLLLDFRPYIDLLCESLEFNTVQPAAASSPPER